MTKKNNGGKILIAWFGGMVIALIAGVVVMSIRKDGKKVIPNILPVKKKSVTDMNISKNGLDFIKSKESLRTKTYKDSGGKLTIGYGHTGKDVKSGMTITEKEAEEIFANDVKIRVDAVKKALIDKGVQYVPQHIFDMFVSHRYNTGENINPILHYIEWGNTQTLWDWWVTHYITVKGNPSDGLVNRRTAEMEILKKGY